MAQDELDSIIQRMIDAGEPEEAIASVIQSYTPNPMADDAANAAAQARAEEASNPVRAILGIGKRVLSGANPWSDANTPESIAAEPSVTLGQLMSGEKGMGDIANAVLTPENIGRGGLMLGASKAPAAKTAVVNKTAGPVGRAVSTVGRGVESLGGPVNSRYRTTLPGIAMGTIPLAIEKLGQGMQAAGTRISNLATPQIPNLPMAEGPANPNWRTATSAAPDAPVPFTPVEGGPTGVGGNPNWRTATTQMQGKFFETAEAMPGGNPNWRTATAGPAEPFTPVPTAESNMNWRTATNAPAEPFTPVPVAEPVAGWRTAINTPADPTAPPVIEQAGRVMPVQRAATSVADLQNMLQHADPNVRRMALTKLQTQLGGQAPAAAPTGATSFSPKQIANAESRLGRPITDFANLTQEELLALAQARSGFHAEAADLARRRSPK